MTRQKGANLLHYYVEKQVFKWRAKNIYIWCINTLKSRFSHDAPKTLIFDALIRGKAGFLMTPPKTKCTFDAILHFVAGFLVTRQKLLYLMHYCVEKQVFSWRAKKVQICCIIMWKSRFTHDAPKTFIFDALIHGKACFLMTPPKTKCTFDAILHFVAGFLVTRQKLLYLMHYCVEKQVLSWCAKKVQICCIIMWKSRFSHDAPKTFIFDALIRGKAGFLMTRQKGSHLLHYYVEKQVFSWCVKKVLIWCIITWKSSFSHDAPKKSYIWCINTWKSRFSHDAPKTLIFDALIPGKAGFLVTRQNTLIFDALIRV